MIDSEIVKRATTTKNCANAVITRTSRIFYSYCNHFLQQIHFINRDEASPVVLTFYVNKNPRRVEKTHNEQRTIGAYILLGNA